MTKSFMEQISDLSVKQYSVFKNNPKIELREDDLAILAIHRHTDIPVKEILKLLSPILTNYQEPIQMGLISAWQEKSLATFKDAKIQDFAFKVMTSYYLQNKVKLPPIQIAKNDLLKAEHTLMHTTKLNLGNPRIKEIVGVLNDILKTPKGDCRNDLHRNLNKFEEKLGRDARGMVEKIAIIETKVKNYKAKNPDVHISFIEFKYEKHKAASELATIQDALSQMKTARSLVDAQMSVILAGRRLSDLKASAAIAVVSPAVPVVSPVVAVVSPAVAVAVAVALPAASSPIIAPLLNASNPNSPVNPTLKTTIEPDKSVQAKKIHEVLNKWGKHEGLAELKTELLTKVGAALQSKIGSQIKMAMETQKDVVTITFKNEDDKVQEKFNLHVAKSGGVSAPNVAMISTKDEKATLVQQMVAAYMVTNDKEHHVNIGCEDTELKKMLEDTLVENGYIIAKSPLEETVVISASKITEPEPELVSKGPV